VDRPLAALADQEGEPPLRCAPNTPRSCRERGSVLPQRAYEPLRMRAVAAERRELIERRRLGRIDDDTYHLLEEELDRAELYAEGPAELRRIAAGKTL